MSDMGEQQTAEAPDTGTQDTQSQEAPATDNVVLSRLNEMSEQIGRLAQQAPPQEQPFQGGIADLPYMEGDLSQQQYDPNQGVDPNGYQPGQYEPDYGMDPQQAQQQAMQQLNEYVSHAVQQAVQPMVIENKVKDLESRYSELKDPAVAKRVFDEAVLYGKRMGNPEIARNPELIELVYLAQQARSNAEQETPADGGSGVHIESGGAAPQPVEEDAGDAMLRAWNIDPSKVG